MNKLFEEISSVERREIVRYYKIKKWKEVLSLKTLVMLIMITKILLKFATVLIVITWKNGIN